MTKKIIIANWKEYVKDQAHAQELLESIAEANHENIDLIVCPSFNIIEDVSKVLSPEISLGAQDMSDPEALTKLGVRYVIIGHSHQRWDLGESDETVNQKLKLALQNNFVPILCLGERERNENFKDFLRQQTEATFAGVSAEDIGRCIIAYEPVWAISSNPDARPDTPESAIESIEVIKNLISADKYLYGGSINPANATNFLNYPGIEGVLIGKASTDKEAFAEILNSVK